MRRSRRPAVTAERGPGGWHSRLSKLARSLGWRVAHHKTGGRRYAPDRETKGFPDFVMARGSRLIFVEVKSSNGRLSEDQLDWLVLLNGCDYQSCFVWGPDDYDNAVRVLT